MSELRSSDGKKKAQRLGIVEVFIATLMSLIIGSWGVRRRRRSFIRRPRSNTNSPQPIMSSGQPRSNSGWPRTNRGRSRIRSGRIRRRNGCGGCGCGCFVILILIPAIIAFAAFVLFRAEIVEIVYSLTGFDLRSLRRLLP